MGGSGGRGRVRERADRGKMAERTRESQQKQANPNS